MHRTQRGVLFAAAAIGMATPTLAIVEDFNSGLKSTIPWTYNVPGRSPLSSENAALRTYGADSLGVNFGAFLYQQFNNCDNVLNLAFANDVTRNWEFAVTFRAKFSQLQQNNDPYGSAGIVVGSDVDNYMIIYIGRDGINTGLTLAGELNGGWFFARGDYPGPWNDDEVYKIKIVRQVPRASATPQFDVFFYRNGGGVGPSGGYMYSFDSMNGLFYDTLNTLGGKFVGIFSDTAGNTDISGASRSVFFDKIETSLPMAGVKTLTGTCTLGDADPAWAPTGMVADVKIVRNGQVVQAEESTLGANGEFTLTTDLSAGPADMYVKVAHWLTKKVPLNITATGQTNVNFTLLNGDVDRDDSVTIFDYLAISDAFDSNAGDPTYNWNADLDKDNSVTIFDYLILSTNFDLTGDSF
ncbi:MAG: hypothetical protein JST40_00630 [Armatimonadetes bacterium]|nr:hypothetical protein [Armatimonadota bacterium]